MNKLDLYNIGVEASKEFLDVNQLPHPVFMTYAEGLQGPAPKSKVEGVARAILKRVSSGPVQGTGTGLYTHGHVFVNAPHSAAPVQKPMMRSWSWPGWKTDRTPVGVVAHEVGHHTALVVSARFTSEQKLK